MFPLFLILETKSGLIKLLFENILLILILIEMIEAFLLQKNQIKLESRISY